MPRLLDLFCGAGICHTQLLQRKVYGFGHLPALWSRVRVTAPDTQILLSSLRQSFRLGSRWSSVRLLDLFCGAGGSAVGYSRAGFDEIVGVDIEPMPNYPFSFVQGDALQPPVRLEDFDLIHASPPCQAYTTAGAAWNNILGEASERNPDLLPVTSEMLDGYPHVIENVTGAPMENYIVLCGLSFGLNVRRHRWFSSSFPLMALPHGDHSQDYVIVFGGGVRGRSHQIGRTRNGAGGPIIRRPTLPLKVGQEAMGIDWMNRKELSEAIPPAYTQFIGEQFLAQRGGE